MIKIQVQKTNRGKTQKGKDKTGLYDGKDWYNILGLHDDLEGKTVDLEEGGFKGWYNLAKVYEQSSQNGHDVEEMNQFRATDMLQYYWGVVNSLVPPPSEESKAAIVNTLMIASTKAKKDSILRYVDAPDEPETDPFA